jgi:poly(hydroxyalkanoate) depolymerase family esterase
MKIDFAAAMRRAALSTRASDVAKATNIILHALVGRKETVARDAASPDIAFPGPKARPTLRLINPNSERIKASGEPEPSSVLSSFVGPANDIGGPENSQRLRKPLGEVLRILRGGRLTSPAFGPLPGMNPHVLKSPSPPPPIPDGAQFLTRSFACAAGLRNYNLYIPASTPAGPRGLLVMLHGCTQDPNDFAVGTNMNAVAGSRGLMVAYPSQIRSANASLCWNWFNPADQTRDAGEPSIIAGLTRDIVSEFGLDQRQVFVAGLSAGGAMAAVMGETYPDLYAAVGIHSGLAYRSANDVMSAFAAMRGPVDLDSGEKLRVAPGAEPRIRTIVFHGSKDQTVHPSNADRLVAAASSLVASGHSRLDSSGSTGGRNYARTVFPGPNGVPIVESWLVDSAGHAWSGGHPTGSFADPKGPDASAEMVRFFLCQASTNAAHVRISKAQGQ